MKRSEKRAAQVRRLVELLRAGNTQTSCAELLGVSRMTVSRMMGEAREWMAREASLPSSKTSEGGGDRLTEAALKSLDVSPRASALMVRKLQRALDEDFSAGKLSAKDAADAWSKLESIRRSAESGIEQREAVVRELSDSLMRVADSVLGGREYERLVAGLRESLGVGNGE